MAFCVNINNLTVIGVQCYLEYFDCFKYFLFKLQNNKCCFYKFTRARVWGKLTETMGTKLGCKKCVGVIGASRLKKDPAEQRGKKA